MNYKILEKCSNIRAKARDSLAGKWWPAIGTILVASLCMAIVPALLLVIFGPDSIMTMIGNIYTILVTGAFSYGICFYAIKLRRGEDVSSTMVFNGFSIFTKTLGLSLFTTIFILLWSLLLIIPGIIAALRYSMSYYVLIDHPEYSIRECVNESKRIMRGNLGKLFLLNLSFIGWTLLVGVILTLIITLASVPVINMAMYQPSYMINVMTPQMATLQLIAIVATTVISVPLYVYIQIASGTFYDILIGRLEGAIKGNDN